MSRRSFVAGNWKQFLLQSEAADLLGALLPKIQNFTDVDVAVCPSYLSIGVVSQRIKGSHVKLGAQNCYSTEKSGKLSQNGAFTGEVSPAMVKDAGCSFVILGHSERRQYFGETDESINTKAKASYEVDLTPIICVGETLEEREGGVTNQVVEEQVKGCLKDLPGEKVRKSVLAYEPVWAIGTGKTASPEQAQEVHAFIRQLLADLYGDTIAGEIRILYGGSVKPGNARELFQQRDIDGGLIGGASLVAEDFAAIIEAAR